MPTSGALRGDAWVRAFGDVGRENFVGGFAVRTKGSKSEYGPDNPSWLPTVYSDVSLLRQIDAAGTATSSSTQPTPMAHMLEALSVEGGGSFSLAV
ncbi:hypothetical protein ACQEVX_29160 [Streptomyces syringium]|uniref:hypothetical protein n=1 Tax=Streptomyces syringium TaxID=76729 RepID=UPI003D920BC5